MPSTLNAAPTATDATPRDALTTAIAQLHALRQTCERLTEAEGVAVARRLMELASSLDPDVVTAQPWEQ